MQPKETFSYNLALRKIGFKSSVILQLHLIIACNCINQKYLIKINQDSWHYTSNPRLSLIVSQAIFYRVLYLKYRRQPVQLTEYRY